MDNLNQPEPAESKHAMSRKWIRFAAGVPLFLLSCWLFERFFSWPFAIPISFLLVRAGAACVILRRRRLLSEKENRELSDAIVSLCILVLVCGGLTMSRIRRSGDWSAHRDYMRDWPVAVASLPKLNYCLSRHENVHEERVTIRHVKGGTGYPMSGRASDHASVDALVQDLKQLRLPFPVSLWIEMSESIELCTDRVPAGGED